MLLRKTWLFGGLLLLGLTLSEVARAQSAAPELAAEREPPPPRLPYEEGQPIPDGYRLRTGPHKGLVIAGAIVGGGAYTFGVMGAIDSDFEDNAAYLLVPLAGPWLMLAAGSDPPRPCPMGEVCPSGPPSYTNLFVGAAGVAQAVGTVLFVMGLTAERRYLRRKDLAVSLMPASFGSDGYGLGAMGTF